VASDSKFEKIIKKILLLRPRRIAKANFKVGLAAIILWQLDMKKIVKTDGDMRKRKSVLRIAYCV
jgi:hypothetical protein